MIRLFAYRRKAFDEPFDGIVYVVMVGMGFATLENIGYVLQHGMGTGILRIFLSVPAHATFAILMGDHLGLAKFDAANIKKIFIPGCFLAGYFSWHVRLFFIFGQYYFACCRCNYFVYCGHTII